MSGNSIGIRAQQSERSFSFFAIAEIYYKFHFRNLFEFSELVSHQLSLIFEINCFKVIPKWPKNGLIDLPGNLG